MASLNTLRTKSGWFLSGIIMLALLAFILGDISRRGQGKNPEVGRINGVKIKYTEFLAQYNLQQEMLGGRNADASEQASNNAWSELVSKNALFPGFNALGLGVSAQEFDDMMNGTGGGYISPVVEQYFRNPQTGMFDHSELEKFVIRLSDEKNENAQRDAMMWRMLQKQAGEERLFSKYVALVSSGVFINDPEVAEAVEAENTTHDARVIFKPYSLIADSTVNVPDSELRTYYNSHKEKFRRVASRDIEYVVFDVVPSQADMAEGQKRADDLAARFAEADDAVAFVTANSDDKTVPAFVREDALAADVAAALIGGGQSVHGPVLNGETYTMSRIAERRMVADSVTIGAIVLQSDKKALADSLMGVINNGNFAELARTYSEDKQSMLAGGATAAMDPLQLLPEMSAMVTEAPVGKIGMVESNGAIFIINVVGKSAPVSKVRLATVTYEVRASAATQGEAMTKANEFYKAASGSYDAFTKSANEMSLPKRVARVSNSDKEVNGLENSLQLVRWAYTNKQGSVDKPVKLTRDYIVVPALAGVTEAGIASFESVSGDIKRLLVQRRKGEMLAEKMTGGSLDEIAAREGLEIIDAPGVKFAAYAVAGAGFEPRLVGAICSTKQAGQVSKPVKGNAGVYVYEVSNIATEESANAESMKVRLESMNEYVLGNSLMNALFKKSNIEDNRVSVGF